MVKKSELPSRPRHINVNDEDWEFLAARFGPTSMQPVGVSAVIREIVHRKVRELRAREIQLRDEQAEAESQPYNGGNHE